VKRTNTRPIKDLLNEYIVENRLGSKIDEARIRAAWQEVMGPLARTTESMSLKKDKLYIHLSSPAVRNELMMQRPLIVRLLNEKTGKDLVKEVIIR
jgi:predicted nucleic acid-binding Zn ribbon protein